jgi:hypothetical protein
LSLVYITFKFYKKIKLIFGINRYKRALFLRKNKRDSFHCIHQGKKFYLFIYPTKGNILTFKLTIE